jgi:hypothetical protein
MSGIMTNSNPTPPEKDPGQQVDGRDIEIPVPTRNPEFWKRIINRAYRDTLTFGLLSTVLILIGVGLDVGGFTFNHAGWSAEIAGFKLQNAGPGDLLTFAALFIFNTMRFHAKARRIFSARAQLMVHSRVQADKTTGAQPADGTADTPPDDTALWDDVVSKQEFISSLFGWIALAMIGMGVVLVGLGFDLSSVSWSAEGFGVKLANTGPGVTLTVAAGVVLYMTSFSAGIEGIGETRTFITRAAWKLDSVKTEQTK